MNRSHLPLPLRQKLAIGLLASAVFCFQYWLSYLLYTAGVFSQYNVLFDSDPNHRLMVFAHGMAKDGRGFVHPGLRYCFSLPIRFIAEGVSLFSWTPLNTSTLREYAALAVVPLTSGVNILLLYGIFLRLGWRFVQATAAVLLGIFSFSNLIFGALPDHFGLSGTLTLLVAYWIVRENSLEAPKRYRKWLMISIFGVGITLTNAVFLALGLFFLERRRVQHLWLAVRNSVALCGLGILLSIGLFSSLNPIYDRWMATDVPMEVLRKYEKKSDSTIGDFNADAHWMRRYISVKPLMKGRDFPVALSNSIIGHFPRKRPNHRALTANQKAKFPSMYTLTYAPPLWSGHNWSGVLCIALLFWGGLNWYRNEQTHRNVLYFSLAVILYNGLFHAYWGDEYFLYSQHWTLLEVLLLSGVLMTKRKARWVRLGFWLFVGYAMVTNIAITLDLWRELTQ